VGRTRKHKKIEKKIAPLTVGLRWVWIASLLLAFSASCSGYAPEAKPTTGRNPIVAEVPNQDETIRGDEDPAIVTLEIGSALHEHKLATTDQLPGNIVIPTTNLNAVPVTAALQAVLAGTDVSLSWNSGTFDDHLVTVMNLSGPLPGVVEKICGSARVFCDYRHGALELRDKETFIIGLPPLAKASAINAASGGGGGGAGSAGTSSAGGGSTLGGTPTAATVASVQSAAGNTMADAISELAADKATIDEQGGNIIYTTDVDGQDRVREYLEELRNGRPLIVLQLYIWEVTLNKENAEGINWKSLSFPKIGGSFENLQITSPASAFPAIGSGVTFGAVTAGRIATSVITSFLSTQGRVQTISNPQITFISGSSAQFMVGGQTNYISSVGQLVTANNVTGTGNSGTQSGVGTNTVATSTISTGLSIGLSGAYESGVILANLNLSLTNLQGLNPTNTLSGTTSGDSSGQTIDLPTTTNRAVSTIIRVRPGDTLVMAGMVMSTDTNNRQGIPLPDDARIPMYGDDTLQNNELVIMVKPSVVLFSDKVAVQEAKAKEEARPMPAALVIDKSGTNTLAIPAATAPSGAATEAAVTLPQPLTPAPTPLQSAPVATDADNAPVDRRLMQRGFSHAFDQLLQPTSSMPQNAADTPSGDKP